MQPTPPRTALNRRRLFGGAVGAASAWSLGSRCSHAAPNFRVEQFRTISQRPRFYHGWPTVTRRHNGDLIVVCSGGRDAHVCPFGWLEMMRSADQGQTWSFPTVALDLPVDVRDAGVMETARGTLLATTFTSFAYEKWLQDAEQRTAADPLAWSPTKLRRWRAAHRRIGAAERERVLGHFMIRSSDGGVTWSAAYRCPVDSPHGPIRLDDGRLLYPGKIIYGRSQAAVGRIGVCESNDDGRTWRWLSEIPVRPGDSFQGYHELHATETADGRIVTQIRNHNQVNEKETIQSESSDGGQTWSVPRPIGVWGFPSHLLRLRDDRLIMTYGYRKQPLGVQARISSDHGRNWSDPIPLHDRGTSSDIGYPSTVQLDDGSLLTVWYELMNSVAGDLDHYNRIGRDEAWFKMTEHLPPAVLRQALWSLTG